MGIWALISYPFRRQPRRMVDYRPAPCTNATDIQLGLEAIDLKLVDKINRRNDALERVTGPNRARHTAAAATDITPFPEDETYAARYHSAFNKKGSKS